MLPMHQIHVQPPAPTSPYGGGYPTQGGPGHSPLGPQQQSMDPHRSRSMVGSVEGVVPGVSRLLFHAYASERVQCMHAVRGIICPCTCACLPGVSEQLRKGRYVQVYDNKIEINEPESWLAGCGTCVITDRVTTVHFDRALAQNARKAEACGPNCAHGDCCPDACGLFGDTLVLHSDRSQTCACCASACKTVNTSSSTHGSNGALVRNVCDLADYLWPCAPCWPSARKLVLGLENATELAQKIDAARALKGAPRAQTPF